MLNRLKIENIALVEQAELLFDPGFSVITGETGAGKSVIVAALSLALGGRADREYIRSGEAKARVEATFDVATVPGPFKTVFADYLVDNRFTVLREISSAGSSRVKINGQTCSLARLKEITVHLAEILGQHANQMLMNEENHLSFIDHFASVGGLREEVGILFGRWEKVTAELQTVRSQRERLMDERELLLFQQAEIKKAKIGVGEEEQLLREKKILDSARSLMETASLVGNILDGDEGSALSSLRRTRCELEKMAAIDNALEPQLKDVIDIDFRLEDLRQHIEKYGADISDNPVRLDEINARLDEIYKLKRKYGGSEASILETLDDINTRLQKNPDIDSRIAELEALTDQMRSAYTEKAVSLTSVRRKAADYLQKLVLKELSELAIDKGGFEFEFLYEADAKGVQLDKARVKPHAYGLETGRFLFSANPGEPLRSLVKTASGGEISRVMLALKAAEKKNSSLKYSLLVFDEVDAGIGGQTATEVGRKLKRLAEECQLVVITHLHQIARLADHHFVAEKSSKRDARSTITVKKIKGDAVQPELDRMVALPD